MGLLKIFYSKARSLRRPAICISILLSASLANAQSELQKQTFTVRVSHLNEKEYYNNLAKHYHPKVFPCQLRRWGKQKLASKTFTISVKTDADNNALIAPIDTTGYAKTTHHPYMLYNGLSNSMHND